MNQILLRGFHQIFDEFQMLIAKMSTALKITEIVSFKIASEASYVYIWLDKKTEACGLTVFIRTKIQMRHFEQFSNIVRHPIFHPLWRPRHLTDATPLLLMLGHLDQFSADA